MGVGKWAGAALVASFVGVCAVGTLGAALVQKDAIKWARATVGEAPALWARSGRDQGVGRVCAKAALGEPLSGARAMAWARCLETGDEAELMEGASKEAREAVEAEREAGRKRFEEAAREAADLYAEAEGALGPKARAEFEREGARTGGVSGHAGRALIIEALGFAAVSWVREGEYERAEAAGRRAMELAAESEAWARESAPRWAEADKAVEREWEWGRRWLGESEEEWRAGPLSWMMENQLRLTFEMAWKASRPAAHSAWLRGQERSGESPEEGEGPWSDYANERAARAVLGRPAAPEEQAESRWSWSQESEAASERAARPGARAGAGRSV